MLEKTFNPAEVEARHYARWEQGGYFAAHPESPAIPFTIMMPPPNVTGSLHMGHALTFTLQDVLVRYQRMRGRDVLWQPGTDHAGIATEIVVTNQLAEQKIDKRGLGRLDARTLYDGPRACRRGAQSVRPSLSRGADLSRQAARQLGPGDAHGHLRPRSRQPRDAWPTVAHPLPDRGRGPVRGGSDDPAGNHARRYRHRRASR